MADSGTDDGSTREDLLQRIELMEAMVAEGRQQTMRCGWIFVLWGLVDLVAMSWRFFEPHSHWVAEWAWPVCLAAGVVLTLIGRSVQKHEQNCSKSTRWRSVGAVWAMMGVALAVFITGGMVSQLDRQYSYFAALLTIIGMAHAISAVILRWRVQGVVAGVWWAGAVAIFFARSPRDVRGVMFVEMCLGMVLFGLYALMLERRLGVGRRHD